MQKSEQLFEVINDFCDFDVVKNGYLNGSIIIYTFVIEDYLKFTRYIFVH